MMERGWGRGRGRVRGFRWWRNENTKTPNLLFLCVETYARLNTSKNQRGGPALPSNSRFRNLHRFDRLLGQKHVRETSAPRSRSRRRSPPGSNEAGLAMEQRFVFFCCFYFLFFFVAGFRLVGA